MTDLFTNALMAQNTNMHHSQYFIAALNRVNMVTSILLNNYNNNMSLQHNKLILRYTCNTT